MRRWRMSEMRQIVELKEAESLSMPCAVRLCTGMKLAVK
jgi:hypothetical protein